jgi:AcrR family transcriptional regulator
MNNVHVIVNDEMARANPNPDGEPDVKTLWREPTQERSRRRVEAILTAARRLIGEKGSEELKMREVAEKAGVPIGSLYQFFPDRNALLACLFARHLGVVGETVRERFDAAKTVEEFEDAAETLISSLHRMLVEDPALVDVWNGIQASKAIRYLDLQDSRRNARFLFETVRRLAGSKAPDDRLFRACFLICDLAGSTSRTALGMPREEGERLVGEYARMARAYLRSVLAASD